MEFSYNYQGGKEEVICHTHMKEFDRTCWENMQGQDFLQARVAEQAGEYIMIYNIERMINLRAWMYEASEKERARMRQEIAEGQRRIFQMGILQEQLITEDKYMYVDEMTQHIKFMCIPLISRKNVQREEKVRKPLYESEIKLEEEPELPSELPVPSEDILDIKSEDSDPVMPEKLEFLQEPENDDTNREEEKAHLYGTSRKNSFQEIHLSEEKKDGSETVFGFTDRNAEKNQTEEDDEDKTVLLKQEEEDDGEDKTVLLKPVFQIKASLYRNKTGEEFKLHKNKNIIGKSKKRADIVITENPAISREHCRICCEEGTYYLQDDSSLNGTWVDDEKVQPEEKIVLQEGCKIRLSDEEFIFHIN